jgi:hypothetical protein
MGATFLAGCYAPPDAPPTARPSALETTALVIQAVDAGTGSALSDEEMTVRYLVRAPIVFDASSVDRVPSIEPYEIEHEVGDPTLVVEVRLEAASYHRLDTVLSVPRGSTAGPLTMRLSPRLDRLAQSPPATTTTATVSPTPPVVSIRSAMQAGDRAFSRGAWLEATEAYQSMPAPDDEMSAYGRDYLEAKIRQGVAHINRSEHGRALEIFEEAADMRDPGPDALLRLAQTQCAVGRTEEGRGTLAQLERARSRMDAMQQSFVSAMIAYRRGVCTHGEFERAETTRDRVRAGAQATQELNAFAEGARAMSPVPPEVYDAVTDAERLVEEIRRTMGGGGETADTWRTAPVAEPSRTGARGPGRIA